MSFAGVKKSMRKCDWEEKVLNTRLSSSRFIIGPMIVTGHLVLLQWVT